MKINLYPYVRAVQSAFNLSLGFGIATDDKKVIHPTNPGERVLVQVFKIDLDICLLIVGCGFVMTFSRELNREELQAIGRAMMETWEEPT